MFSEIRILSLFNMFRTKRCICPNFAYCTYGDIEKDLSVNFYEAI